MKEQVVYLGWRDRDGRHTRRVYLDRVTAIPVYGHLLNCSPEDLSWADVGFGAAQLAFAIIMDVCQDQEIAHALYQSYKRSVIAGLDRGAWCLTADSVRKWVERQQEIASQSEASEG